MLRWGVLGTARIARKRMIPAIQRVEGHRIVAIAGRDLSKVCGFESEFDIPKTFFGDAAFDELLGDDEVDAVYVPVPTSLHAEWTARALRAGKHVLCEKPLAYDAEDVQEILDVQRDHHRLVMENYSYLLTAGYGRLRELILTGELGLPRSLQIVLTFPATREHEIRFVKSLGGGCLLDLACYGIDLAHRLFNVPLHLLEACATPAYGEQVWWGSGPSELVETELWCSLRTESHVEVTIRASFAGARQQTVLLICDEGMVLLPTAFLADGASAVVFLHRRGGGTCEHPPMVDQHEELIRLFGEACASGGIVQPEDEARWRWNAQILQHLHALVQEQIAPAQSVLE